MTDNIKARVNKYINDVINNRIVVGELVRLTVERHLRDLEQCPGNGFKFDEKEAKRSITFFETFLHHGKGSKFAGNKFELSPWQCFVNWCVYGWKNAGDGSRRFQEAYLEVAKKNGKTTWMAGQVLYALIADAEPAAEIYSVATTRDQAKQTYEECKNIIRHSPHIAKMIKVWTNSITYEKGTTGFFKPLASDSDTLDGKNSHVVIVDEYHAHKDDSVVDNMKSGMAARQQPLMWYITTAGFNKNRPCFAFRDTCIKVLKQILNQENLFVMIHTADKDDDWEEETTWIKGNPNIGISVSLDFLRKEYIAAKNNPRKLVNFKTKHLNQWVDAENVWIEHDTWTACNKGEEDLTGYEAYGGLDLASVRDLTAFCLRFQKPDGTSFYKWRFYVPEDSVQERVKDKGIPYDVWIEEGLIFTTPGNITDYNYIKAHIKLLCEDFKIKKIGYDRWNSSQLVIDLISEGIQMEAIGQGYASMSAPTKEFEKEILSGKMNHAGNPVMTWQISNVHIQRDPSDNIKVDKAKSSEKVDGVVAAIMAKAMYMIDHGNEAKPDPNEIYKNQGVRTL
jgi:phage terminase large subunit-like protein